MVEPTPLRPGERQRLQKSGDGGGPEDPMLEQRVGKLEAEMSEIKIALVKLDSKFDKLDAKFDGKLGEMDGRLNGKLSAIEGRLSGISKDALANFLRFGEFSEFSEHA